MAQVPPDGGNIARRDLPLSNGTALAAAAATNSAPHATNGPHGAPPYVGDENGKSLTSLHLGHTPNGPAWLARGYHTASLLVGSLDRCHRRRQFALAFTGAGMAARR